MVLARVTFNRRSFAILVGVVATGVVALAVQFWHSPVRLPQPLPEPVPPVLLIDAYGLLDGGSKVVQLRDSENHQYDFCIPRGHLECCDEHRDDLYFRDGNQVRLIAPHSADADILERALRMSLVDPSGDELATSFAEETLKLFKDLGETWHSKRDVAPNGYQPRKYDSAHEAARMLKQF